MALFSLPEDTPVGKKVVLAAAAPGLQGEFPQREKNSRTQGQDSRLLAPWELCLCSECPQGNDREGGHCCQGDLSWTPPGDWEENPKMGWADSL